MFIVVWVLFRLVGTGSVFAVFLSCVCMWGCACGCVGAARPRPVQLYYSVDLHSKLYMLVFTFCFSNKIPWSNILSGLSFGLRRGRAAAGCGVARTERGRCPLGLWSLQLNTRARRWSKLTMIRVIWGSAWGHGLSADNVLLGNAAGGWNGKSGSWKRLRTAIFIYVGGGETRESLKTKDEESESAANSMWLQRTWRERWCHVVMRLLLLHVSAT